MHEKARESIIDLMAKIGHPLTPEQGVMLAGAIAVWITKAQRDGYDSATKFVPN